MIKYNEPSPGDVTLIADLSAATQLIKSGSMTKPQVEAAIVAFFAGDKAPALTRADISAIFSRITSIPIAELTAFFNGSLS